MTCDVAPIGALILLVVWRLLRGLIVRHIGGSRRRTQDAPRVHLLAARPSGRLRPGGGAGHGDQPGHGQRVSRRPTVLPAGGAARLCGLKRASLCLAGR